VIIKATSSVFSVLLVGFKKNRDVAIFENLWVTCTRESRGMRTLRWSSSRTRFTRAPQYLVDLPAQLYSARIGGVAGRGLLAERDQFEGIGGASAE